MSRRRAALAVVGCLLMTLSVIGPAVATTATTTPTTASTSSAQQVGTTPSAVAAGDVRVDSPEQARRIAQQSSGKVDVVFVVDDSGSMGDNIDGVKQNIRGFANDIEEEGVDARYALITFSREPEIDQGFTDDPGEMEEALDDVSVSGGLEDNFDALKLATEMDFRPGAKRVIVDITDEDADLDPVTDLRMPEVIEFMEPFSAYVAVSEDPPGSCADPPTASCKDKRALAGTLDTGSYVDLGQIDENDEQDFGDILEVIEEIVTDVADEPGNTGVAGPDIEYNSRELSETTVRPGEPFRINVTVFNSGSVGGRYTALFQSDLTLVNTTRGELRAGEGQRLSVRTKLEEPGDHRVFVSHRYVGTVTVEGEPFDPQQFLEVRESFTTRIALTPGDTYETVSVVHNTDSDPHEFDLNYTREGVVNTTLNETVELEGGETRLVRHERKVPGDADEAIGVEELNNESVGNLSVSDGGGTFGTGLIYAYVVATPDGDDPYKLVMVLQNPGDETATYPLQLVPPNADRTNFARYMEDIMNIERTLGPGETAVIERGVDRATANSPPFGEFNWRVNGISVPVVVDYGDLRDDDSGSDGDT